MNDAVGRNYPHNQDHFGFFLSSFAFLAAVDTTIIISALPYSAVPPTRGLFESTRNTSIVIAHLQFDACSLSSLLAVLLWTIIQHTL